MKRFSQHYILIFCLLLWGCGERTTILDILEGLGDDIPTDAVQYELSPKVWEILQKYRDGQVTELQRTVHLFPTDENKEKLQLAEIEAETLKQLQEAFYNRYIDADGVAIVGNDFTPDHHFVIAKTVFLMMTTKRPELRDPMRDTFYLTLVGGPGMRGWPIIATVPEIEIWINLNDPYTFSGLIQSSAWYPSPLTSHERLHITIAIASQNHSRDNELMTTVVHELAHAFMLRIARHFDDDFWVGGVEGKVVRAYENAKEKDLWPDFILTETPFEFFAELVERWFHGVGTHWSASFETYEEWEAHDPLTYELLNEWFPQVSFWGLWGRDD